jgi:hypothetical protein
MKIACDTPFHRSASLDYPIQCCGNCKFWWGEGDDPNRYMNHDGDEYWASGAGDIKGDCRRFPPTLLPERLKFHDGDEMLEANCPQTNTLYWCGEYQPRQRSAVLQLVRDGE